ncbi:unnamed protein product [Prorocentrum cordatum]|uniref:Altered inheritance of mitochondria protein 24, mitochondrial n=1 Tax=Prorocentrum cordatum TaxID=2364126 RepID=A0ABN9PLR9_9DINO|nr:unnamed protein product [Polarella glacialis]
MPPAKRARADGEAEAGESEELEKDAPPRGRGPFLDRPVGFDPAGCSLNVLSMVGGVLMSLSDGGTQFLIGGARANVGLKAGRYMYEVKVVEMLQPDEGKQYGQNPRSPKPKQVLRVGFSTSASSLILGDGAGGVGFDADGSLMSDEEDAETREQVRARAGRRRAP